MSEKHSSASATAKTPAQFKQRVLVLGTGISGLSVTNELLKRKDRYDVTNWYDPDYQIEASPKAAAFWYPFVAEPEEKVAEWSVRTFVELQKLVMSREAAVRMTPTRELFRNEGHQDPLWKDAIPDFRRATKAELPPGYVDAFLLTVPVIHARYHLQWLLGQNREQGAKEAPRKVLDINEAFDEFDIVFNCTGLGARHIRGAEDPLMTPVRGDLVRIENPGDITAE